MGGIAKGTTFDNTPLKEILGDLLYPYVRPSISLSSSTGKVFEIGTTITPTFSVSVTAGSKSITSVGLYNGSTSLKTLNATAGGQSVNDVSLTTTTTVTAKVSDGTNTVTSGGVTFTAVNPFYWGSVSSAPTTSEAVKALNKKVETKGSKTISHTTTASAGRYCFCYPASYGNLSKILDGNQFDNTADFTKTTVNVTNAAGTSVVYNVYTYNNVVTAGLMDMTYSF